MAGGADIARSAKELQGRQQDMLDAVSGMGSGAGGFFSGLSDFFHNVDNLLALGVCVIAVVGIYRLLRSEHIIPGPSPSAGGPGLAGLLASPMARRMIVRALFAIVLAAVGLAVASGRLTGLLELFKSRF